MAYTDAERLVVDYLNSQSLGAAAYYDVPSKRPNKFIVVERTGGGLSDLVVSNPMLDIQCWAKSRLDSSSLASSVIDAIAGMPYTVANCFNANITSEFRDYDLESGTPRYHIVTELTLNY